MKVNIFHLSGSANCRLCGSCPETIDHLLTSCSVIAQSWYKFRHDVVAQIIHRELARKGNIEINSNWWEHHDATLKTFMGFHHSD